MIVDRKFFNVRCDHCGALFDVLTWYEVKDDISGILEECGWIECEGRHYCDECWTRDDDDNIVTKDGRKWYDYDHREILTDEQRYRLDYLRDLLDPKLTITQIRMEIIKAVLLYKSMVGTVYKYALNNEIHRALDLLEARRQVATEGERDAHDTFLKHHIFDDLMWNGFPNGGKDVNIY